MGKFCGVTDDKVPNRLNYVLWIQDLLDTTPQQLSILDNPEEKSVVGLDMYSPLFAD